MKRVGIWFLFGALICMTLSAGSLRAQTAPGVDVLLNTRVSVSADTQRLFETIKTLMHGLNASYVIDDSLRQSVITADLRDVSLRNALDAVLKSASPPAAYHIEEGVFYITPRTAADDIRPVSDIEPEPDSKAEAHFEVIQLIYADPLDFVPALGGKVFQANYQNFGFFGGKNSGSNSGRNPFGGGSGGVFIVGGGGLNFGSGSAGSALGGGASSGIGNGANPPASPGGGR